MYDFLLKELFTNKSYFEDAVKVGFDKDIPRAILSQISDTDFRIEWMNQIARGEYIIFPPRTALIPKPETGTFRKVKINQPLDRIFLRAVNSMLMNLTRETMIHENCRSYIKDDSCGKTVKDISSKIASISSSIAGFKADLSKYFDSVPIEFIEKAFDGVEERFGHSAVIDVLRAYYKDNRYFEKDESGMWMLCDNYESLKQGCAVSSWLADVILYDLDAELSNLNGTYIRYCDDILYVGDDYAIAMQLLVINLKKKSLILNPKKVEFIDANHWVKFLGFSIKGSSISISESGLEKFQQAIDEVTIKYRKKTTVKQALKRVWKVLYDGYNGYSWAKRVLPVINVHEDLIKMNGYILDSIRACVTNKRKIGGLGFVKTQPIGCVARGKGQNVKANKEKIPQIDGYYSLQGMKNVLEIDKFAYESLVRTNL